MSENVKKLGKEFIESYLKEIRCVSSVIPNRDRGLLPFYWYRPAKITIFVNHSKDLAISIDDIVKGKKDRITIRDFLGRIEETHFPKLDYSEIAMFGVREARHHIIISGREAILDVGTHPVIKIGKGAEMRFLNIRVESRVKGYPREKNFVWFLTYPNEKYMDTKRAISEARYDFGHYLADLAIRSSNDLLSRGVAQETALLLIESLEILRKECHSLITREDLREQTLQNYLERHYTFLNPRTQEAVTLGERKLGPYIPDFVLKYDDETYTLVEIQLNNDPILQNGSPSKGMSEALDQLKNWYEWLKDNKPSRLPQYNGLILIGRRDDYEKNEKSINLLLKSLKLPSKLLTYDHVEDRIVHLIEFLKKNLL